MTNLIISRKRLYINDPFICNLIENLNIQNIHFSYSYDLNGSIVLTVNIPPEDILLLDISWFKVYKKRMFYINLPTFLKPYIGMTIQYYNESIFNTKNELFRIRPINFKFNTNIETKKYNFTLPYFDRSHLVVPKVFINNNFEKKILMAKMCFDTINKRSLDEGYLVVRIVYPPDISSLSYFLNNAEFYLITNRLTDIKKMLKNYNKQIYKFKYVLLDKEHSALVFKEEINAEQ